MTPRPRHQARRTPERLTTISMAIRVAAAVRDGLDHGLAVDDAAFAFGKDREQLGGRQSIEVRIHGHVDAALGKEIVVFAQ